MKHKASKKRIFIGGTGRSGTTVLSRFIGSHEEVVKVPFESRFIIDYNGLNNLYDALHNNYSFDQGRVAIREFRNKMAKQIIYKNRSPYIGHGMYNNKKFIIKRTEELVEQLSEGKYRGADYHSKDEYNIVSKLRYLLFPFNQGFRKLFGHPISKVTRFELFGPKGVTPLEEIIIPKYFENDQPLLDILSTYVDDIFREVCNSNKSWCEDTPANIYNIKFLSRLYPDAYFLHVMRHPVGVAFSMKTRVWAPNDIDKVCSFLQNLYDRSIYCHEWALNNCGDKYQFFKLEDLHSHENFDTLTDFLQLEKDKYNGSVTIDLDRMNYFTNSIDKEELNYIQDKLSRYIDYFGYQYFKK